MSSTSIKLNNSLILEHHFLEEMYQDSYFPNHLVDQCKAILLQLCANIEQKQPQSLDELYQLSHIATEQINDMEAAFDEHDSEIETVARDCLGMDFLFIAQAYDFTDADAEDLIAPREW